MGTEEKMTRSDIDLNEPAFYNNRELSWLAFNERVLEEAIDERNPLLERLKFLAIFSSNLDEFFMVRVAGLKDQVKAGFNKPENKAGLTPKQQLRQISERNHQLVQLQDRVYTETIMPMLSQHGIQFLTFDELSDKQRSFLEKRFDHYIFPVLTPMAVDAYRPFPMLLNKSLNLAVVIKNKESDSREQLAIVQVPSVLNRFILLPCEDGKNQFILLENVISYFIEKLFKGYTVKSVSPFRITRNADLPIHEEGARDLLREIEKELKKRKWGAAVRLEMQEGLMDPNVLKLLLDVLEIHKNDVYSLQGPLDLTFLFKLYNRLIVDYEHLTNETLIPQPPEDLIGETNIFDAILKRDIFLHHPYESFQPVIDFIATAAEDPQVLAIKQTLYRVSGDSPIINALARAAENGKQVTVLVELKARFDEENNIQWAKKLEKSGVHVIYGITGLKTHSKITLVVRHHNDEIQRFVHLGTGNYNDSTAKLYTDMGLLTADEEFGIDATNFFNHLSGYSEKPQWHHLSTAPFEIRDTFLDLIDQEIECHKQNGNGHIIAKMNSLTDKPIILKLYEASRAGVRIELIVRGICCLRPGIPNVSEHIRVFSIVDRFLEHSRIFYFHHGGDDKVFLSSADWMTRNMEKRIEILFPIYQQSTKRRIIEILTITLLDNMKAREQNQFGQYRYVKRNPSEQPVQSQLTFFDMASRFSDSEAE
ncbi:RNA degradosome polyphosphate kinase [Halalkalibacterium halodurans]|uniref:Polyphosphate kinase n=1 Tax=Halalkalibacterium halodurans TaxID=86665 RepID=A0A0M0KL77_ALKHA|nr:RNA degradosome polyphosphate kinase [Halalkalibacterium halodurans]MED3646487.1 RNA degradosome polyphosphate kinase [Halalkalibacterium halodurans]MED4081778.1 RNA degradosome polyphosphate kinase [Halalkalibacterium halodurans]MED4087052.1 RNA degradosome polyphosphate kinase [Halalkalibacterium halodurans]MED4103871.1 RNA degradosome polyphosphate kinase [Halalkalibacterium halodurans]MED4110873.1 RNA degradosome polyphosphate kinase [Halalkalibacterium halodurans]